MSPAPFPSPDLSSGLAALRDSITAGDIAERVDFAPGVSLIADAPLGVGGTWRSPAGRLLELDIAMTGRGSWIALHLALDLPDLAGIAFVGLGCTSAGTGQQIIRPCLRSGLEEGGFVDCFLDRHILTRTDPVPHVDALHVPSCRPLPETAPWRELLLFLPTEPLRWHLHDLRVFAV